MRLALIGLRHAGIDIVRRLMQGGHEVVVYDHDPQSVGILAGDGAMAATSLIDLVAQLTSPRVLWIVLPADEETEIMIAELLDLLDPGDLLVDGGHTFYKDDIRRAASCRQRALHYVDVGISNARPAGDRGLCMTIGGDASAVELLDPILASLAPGLGDIARTHGRLGRDDRAELGYVHVGPAGAGHFVGMIQEGVEYGLMQAYAEGFEILRGRASEKLPSEVRFQFNLADIAEVWRRGSIISSKLLDLIAAAFAEDGDLRRFNGRVGDAGDGQRTIEAAMEEAVPAQVLSAALFVRYRSRGDDPFGDKVLSAVEFGAGGHLERSQ
ncbi:NADP-dependent phosphogluconate dehydrogenase [Sphingosinicellaceae bacterium]|nr:NADP-dependent phosphogluconate dehydrogenase [Sphingosinicellaceae bacterium]